jgi:hypothetical protein
VEVKDFAEIAVVIFAMEVIDHLFGRAVGLAVAVTAFVACILFLWHAGKNKA